MIRMKFADSTKLGGVADTPEGCVTNPVWPGQDGELGTDEIQEGQV